MIVKVYPPPPLRTVVGVPPANHHPGLSARNALPCEVRALDHDVVGEAVGLMLMRQLSPSWAMMWYGSVIVFTIAVVALVADWRIYSRAQDVDRSLKFLRVAYVWLFISLGMLVLLPAYQAALGWLAPTSAAAQTNSAQIKAYSHVEFTITGAAARTNAA